MVKNMLDGLRLEPGGVWQLEGFVLHNADPAQRIMVCSAEKHLEDAVDTIHLRLSFVNPPPPAEPKEDGLWGTKDEFGNIGEQVFHSEKEAQDYADLSPYDEVIKIELKEVE